MANKLKHLALVLDGNRRFAKKLMKKPWEGHNSGAETVEKLLDWVKEFGIKELTLYSLSTENLKRDKKEVEYLLKLMKKYFNKLKNDARINNDKVKIKIIGKLDLLPKDMQELYREIEEKTKNHNNFKINFCIAYGGRLELLEAIKKLKDVKNITEQDITDSLWLKSEPDLIIRTGNVVRTSNFLPWQSVYSEWIFMDKLWPEFNKQDLQFCLEEFKNRKRNFGK